MPRQEAVLSKGNAAVSGVFATITRDQSSVNELFSTEKNALYFHKTLIQKGLYDAHEVYFFKQIKPFVIRVRQSILSLSEG
jgi:hypothetical protein